ncbi:Hypothetical protein NGAL_HAMBI2605_50830 [Neorhizobium galegae bv. orientalis]|nr:Hypothetical protein NGAL_HAMBI2605_50830 [Neorhizobium galegae bv. orientalis]
MYAVPVLPRSVALSPVLSLISPPASPPSSSGLTRGSTRRHRSKDAYSACLISGIKHLTTFSSPPLKPMPTIHPSRFGYAGPHNRRDGTGDLANRCYASGLPGAAQKMVPLSPYGGACVCRTQPGMASVLISTELNSISPQRDRSCAEKHTERDTSRVTIKISIRGIRRVPAETEMSGITKGALRPP